MFEAQRIQPLDVLLLGRCASGLQVLNDLVHVERVPENDHVHYQTERLELVFLPCLILLPHLSFPAMKNSPGKTMAPFTPQ